MKDFGINIEEYIKNKEPEKLKKAYNWKTAIGLQDVDGIKTSEYLISLATKNINGDLTLEETKELLNTYYKEKDVREDVSRTQEADKVAVRITELLNEPTFVFSKEQLLSIHKRLFKDIYKFAGTFRDYNITKKEWILNGETVYYSSCDMIKESLDYDFELEKKYKYGNNDIYTDIKHLARFIANVWQVHPFGEGNTRTCAVFLIKYLKKIGFNITNQLFEDNSLYFRNSLVRANYQNINLKISETTIYLELFLRNLLLNEKNELKNRTMHVSYDKFTSITDKPDKTGQDRTSSSLPDMLLQKMEDKEYSLKDLMELVQIKHRETFMNNYLNPLLKSEKIERKYDMPNHPKQKYKIKK